MSGLRNPATLPLARSLAALAVAVALLAGTAACDGDEEGQVTGSGTVEATTVAVTSATGGRVIEVFASEGSEVSEGDKLLQLDTVLIDAALDEARAAKEIAELQLSDVSNGARPDEIRAAEAELSKAMAAWDGARRAWTSAEDALENPVDLDYRIAEAETAVALAQVAVAQTRGKLVAARSARDALPLLSTERAAADVQVQTLEATLGAAQSSLEAVNETLALLEDAREDPAQLELAADGAESAYRQAEAMALAAQQQVSLLGEGPTAAQVDAADAGLAQAAAAVQALEAQRDELLLRAPISGTLVTLTPKAGELAAPGASLARVADLDEVEITIYVPETRIADIHLGQAAEVTVDAIEDETFDAVVSFIGSEAEFTPRNVQTEEQRANLVIAVKVRLDNGDHLLKQGMPAEVTIDTE